MSGVKRIVHGGELVLFPLNLPGETGWGCGVLCGYVPASGEIIVSFGDCERTIKTDKGAAMARPEDFYPEAGYLVGRVFKDEKEVAKEMLPLLKPRK